jgi:hypothetical protein
MATPSKLKPSPRPPLRQFEVLLFFAVALGTVLFAYNIVGPRLFLIYVYGWDKVQAGHLRLMAMPKGEPWPVSNGDMIRQGFFIHYLISLACWYAMFLGTYPWLRRLLPACRAATQSANPGLSREEPAAGDTEATETISNCTWSLPLQCPRRWSGLRETAEPGIRRCEACLENVYLCFNQADLSRHTARGRRVALTSDVLPARFR